MTAAQDHLENRTIKKVTRRLILFLGLPYVISFVDRVNMGFGSFKAGLLMIAAFLILSCCLTYVIARTPSPEQNHA